MKNSFLIGAVFLFLVSCTFSVGNKKDKISKPKSGYYCPMFCEKEKTYLEQGTCPVCKMDLVKAEK